MGAAVVADTGFLVALLSGRDRHHGWASQQAANFDLPWHTCESVLSEAFHLLEWTGRRRISDMLRRKALLVTFDFTAEMGRVLALMEKYRDLPMGFADACLVIMSELESDPVVLTTDSHFRIYRRHSRQVVPCILPS